jgi:lysophospholipase L1-like esterase
MHSLIRRAGVVLATAALVLGGALASPAAAQQHPVPNSMASMGDSITRAFNACGWYFDCVSRSFSTGSHSSVNSHYLRIRAVNPAIHGNNFNHGASGARAVHMAGQATSVVNRGGIDYVTILIGANDACTSSEGSMTPVETFRDQIDEALDILQAGLPDARVAVISIPDIKRLWEVGHTSSSARFYWSLYSICQSMLANPTSFHQADVDRRDRVQQRVIDFNTQLAEACAAYGANCVFDDNAVFNFPFELSHLSTWDYFHPNTTGQALLAQFSYEATFNW